MIGVGYVLLSSLKDAFECDYEFADDFLRGSALVLRDEETKFYVAFKERKIVGFLGFYVTEEDGIEISSMLVKEELRRKGIGMGLVAKVEDLAKNIGFSEIKTSFDFGFMQKYFEGKLGYSVLETDVFDSVFGEQRRYVKTLQH